LTIVSTEIFVKIKCESRNETQKITSQLILITKIKGVFKKSLSINRHQ
jgi:hypothetical protein